MKNTSLLISLTLLFAVSLMAAQATVGKAAAPAAPPAQPNLLNSTDFTPRGANVDNLWDGVNKDGEIQLKPIEVYFFNDKRSIGPGKIGNPICYADVDGDGTKDLVVASESGFIWFFRRINKTFPPKFDSGRFLHGNFGACVTGVEVCDMDGDGLADLVVGGDDGSIYYVKGRKGGLFSGAPEARVQLNGNGKDDAAYTGRQLSPRIYDWDGDGNNDLIYGEGSYSANAVYILFNKGTSAAPNYRNQKAQWLAYGYGREQLSPTIWDINGDNKPDLLVGALDGKLYYYQNVGFKEDQVDAQYLLEDKKVARFANVPENFLGIGVRPYLADLDGDKKPELLISCANGKIYAAKFQGPLERMEFSEPVLIKGTERLKPYPGPPPATWYGHHEDDSYAYWNPARYGGNTGCNIKYMSETDPLTQQKYSFARAYYEGGYLGKDSYFANYYNNNVENLDYGSNYRLTFKVRGYNMKAICKVRQIYEEIVKGDTISTESRTKEYPVSPSQEWTDCSFVYSPEFFSNRRKHPSVSLSFKLDPSSTNAFFDVRDLRLEKIQ